MLFLYKYIRHPIYKFQLIYPYVFSWRNAELWLLRAYKQTIKNSVKKGPLISCGEI